MGSLGGRTSEQRLGRSVGGSCFIFKATSGEEGRAQEMEGEKRRKK